MEKPLGDPIQQSCRRGDMLQSAYMLACGFESSFYAQKIHRLRIIKNTYEYIYIYMLYIVDTSHLCVGLCQG